MKNKKINEENRGIRTFLLYTFIVAAIVFVSLTIKAFFVFQENKFDGKNLNLLISQNNRVVALAGFDSSKNSITYLKLNDSLIPTDLASSRLEIIYDAKINSSTDLSKLSITSILVKSAFKQESITTDLTIFDIVQLLFLSKTINSSGLRAEEIKDRDDKILLKEKINELFKNDLIVSENISIQIINATGHTGLGNRLERSLSSIGVNVIAVSSSRSKEANSKIKYFGDESYTSRKMHKILQYPVEKLNEKSIADIIIIIGEDSENNLGI